MSIPLNTLNNLTFDELVKEAKSLIPIYAPEWTNHNPSEPGITLLELFAWLCDMMLYRVDQVSEKTYIKFLNLLGITLEEGEELSSGIRRGVKQLSECTRAITAEDFEDLARRALLERTEVTERFPNLKVRTICFTNRDLENNKDLENNFGHVSVILIAKAADQLSLMKEIKSYREYIKEYLSERKLLTNRVHVVEPDYQDISIRIVVSAKDQKLASTVKEAIESFVDPITGGPVNNGWPLGRNIYNSDLYYIVESISGVDHVIRIELEAPELKPYQLVKIKELVIEVEV